MVDEKRNTLATFGLRGPNYPFLVFGLTLMGKEMIIDDSGF